MNAVAPRRRADAADLGAVEPYRLAASAKKKSWLRIGARSAAQIGNPGTKLSGNAISDAPLPAASSIRLVALSIVRALSRKIGAAWQAAALKLG